MRELFSIRLKRQRKVLRCISLLIISVSCTIDSISITRFFNHFVIIDSQTSLLGHFLLTYLLLPKLKASKQGRIINISAQAHTQGVIYFDDLNLEKDFSAIKSFGQSKLALILMARHMSKLLQGEKLINITQI
jgi:NAD(P)-dependent dehydrogenase (short-subunit alcohol dehydrogenase family)